MTTYTIHAEHCSGKSVGHPCSRGVYSDPVDTIEGETVQAENEDEGLRLANARLLELVETAEPCDCRRRLSPGGNSWWDSVALSVEPVDTTPA